MGRLLAATPSVTVAEAVALAAGPPRYVAVRGRIDAEDDFEDDAHRPLVLRRTRLELRDGRAWTTVDEHARPSRSRSTRASTRSPSTTTPSTPGSSSCRASRSAPPPTSSIACPPGRRRDRPLRLRVEQVSSVEHAIVLGVPVAEPDGSRAADRRLGRPLVLTTLEHDEAMRVLTGRRPPARPPRAAAVALGAGLVLRRRRAWPGPRSGPSTATAPGRLARARPAARGGDPRSTGQGPGLVGDPLLAIGLVIAIGVVAMLATLAYVRLTGGRRVLTAARRRSPAPTSRAPGPSDYWQEL